MPDIVLFGVPPLAMILGVLVGALATEETIRLIRRALFIVVGLFALDVIVACVVVRMRFDAGYRDLILQLAIVLGFYSIFAFFAGLALTFRSELTRAGVGILLTALAPVPIFLIAGVIQKAF